MIKSTEYILRDNKLYNKITFVCRNKKCDNYLKEVGTDLVEQPVTIEEAPSE